MEPGRPEGDQDVAARAHQPGHRCQRASRIGEVLEGVDGDDEVDLACPGELDELFTGSTPEVEHPCARQAG